MKNFRGIRASASSAKSVEKASTSNAKCDAMEECCVGDARGKVTTKSLMVGNRSLAFSNGGMLAPGELFNCHVERSEISLSSTIGLPRLPLVMTSTFFQPEPMTPSTDYRPVPVSCSYT